MKIEKPELFPAYVYLQPPDVNAVRLRGKALFDLMAGLGYRVQQIPGAVPVPGAKQEAQIGIYKPWTFVFVPVGYADIGPLLDSLEQNSCSFIMDCHFPIMDMSRIVADAETFANVAGNRDVMLANLRIADAVTCPKAEWAADLAEVNPNVFLLPDLELPDFCYGPSGDLDAEVDADDFDYEGENPIELINAFIGRFVQIALESSQAKQRRWAAAK